MQQVALWANFSGCFCPSPANPQLAAFLISGCRFLTNANPGFNAMPHWDSHFTSLFHFVSFEASACLCSLGASYPVAVNVEDPGKAGVKPLGWRRKGTQSIWTSREYKWDGPTPLLVLPLFFFFFVVSLILAAGWLWCLGGQRLGSWDRNRALHYGTRDKRWDLSRFIHPFIQNPIASHDREEEGTRHLVFLTAVLLN